jgi:hypothetical protein
MKPIKIIYDETGNTLYVRFSDKRERYCTEIDGGGILAYPKQKTGR